MTDKKKKKTSLYFDWLRGGWGVGGWVGGFAEGRQAYVLQIKVE